MLHRLALLGVLTAALWGWPKLATAAEHAATKDGGSVTQRTDLFLSQLTFFERNYFIAGPRKSQAKFQLSLRYNLWPNTTPHAVYVGYTQTSFWNIYEWSGPYTEFNFTPVLFYEYRVPRPENAKEYCGPSFVRWALDHSSNGLVGVASRAFNRLSSTVATGCYNANGQHFETKVQLWPPLIFDGEQEDIEAYIGYGELTFEWASARSPRWIGQLELGARFRKGASEDPRRGAVYLDAAWNPTYSTAIANVWRFTPYLYAQFFTGYAESLSTYNIMHTHFRVGFGLNDVLAIGH